MARVDPKLSERANTMRGEPTPGEVVLWRHLSNSRLGGFKFRLQSVIEPFIVDFLCPAKALIVEVDGETHDVDKDAGRTSYLTGKGYKVIRFTSQEVIRETGGVLTAILNRLLQLPDRWPIRLPHPNPSPEGEGL